MNFLFVFNPFACLLILVDNRLIGLNSTQELAPLLQWIFKQNHSESICEHPHFFHWAVRFQSCALRSEACCFLACSAQTSVYVYNMKYGVCTVAVGSRIQVLREFVLILVTGYWTDITKMLWTSLHISIS